MVGNFLNFLRFFGLVMNKTYMKKINSKIDLIMYMQMGEPKSNSKKYQITDHFLDLLSQTFIGSK